ncbi:cyclopropane-fatty-acyl-phospholipid synthase family protein [Conexibacter sp. CPCC 206217]|uniref:SAM-dependent methyltransferase n=1 Tax=Conexibacter sp. CPCC 206217 TaxID=3064574 RepID=UPI0027186EB3|nr:cyclopropane-fatty-acyl-phospholipid synthase family protein [Conexibacter sp. CPCC 206217]MDO8212296.1 cyclopropane-fatty-acyl-phospholipid synthase family protein [Conexibacter sp. CPCC 206217]
MRRLPFAVAFWDGSVLPAGETPSIGTVRVRRRAIAHLLHEPNQLGLVRAFVLGDLDLDGDIEALLALRGRFRGVEMSHRDVALGLAGALLLGGRGALRPPRAPASELRAEGHRHSLRRDRTVVQHHYDVSNAFYRRLLGPTLVYSCAYFESPDDSLEAAQERKLELICRKLRLQPGERLLDVGCGWGSLLLHAAERHGVRGVGITLSEEQAALARERVRDAGLQDRIEIRVADYREVDDGPYDKIASVGMVEHVGLAQLDTYAATLARLLRPGGLLLNHGIAQLFSQPAGEKSLIQRYVFPDGELPQLGVVIGALQSAGLEPRDVESLREHYALTLRRWLANLTTERDGIVAEVGEERERVWRLYMLGSALAFEDDDISIFQVLATRPGAAHELPLVRAQAVEPAADAL